MEDKVQRFGGGGGQKFEGIMSIRPAGLYYLRVSSYKFAFLFSR